MTLLTLTAQPSEAEQSLFEQMLTPDDIILLSGQALSLAFRANNYPATAVVRQYEINNLGGKPHPDWTLISNQSWVELSVTHKTIVW